MARVSRLPSRRNHSATGGVHGPYGSGSTVHQKDGPDAVTWVTWAKATCEQNTLKSTKLINILAEWFTNYRTNRLSLIIKNPALYYSILRRNESRISRQSCQLMELPCPKPDPLNFLEYALTN